MKNLFSLGFIVAIMCTGYGFAQENPALTVKCDAVDFIVGGRFDRCYTFQCEGIDEQVILEPSDVIVNGEMSMHDFFGPRLEMINETLDNATKGYRTIVSSDGEKLVVRGLDILQWISVPLGVAYNYAGLYGGLCNGPFDQVIE